MMHRREVLRVLKSWSLAAPAFIWRRLLFRTQFIAIGGSAGKTTAKDLLAGMLSTAGPTAKTRGSNNSVSLAGQRESVGLASPELGRSVGPGHRSSRQRRPAARERGEPEQNPAHGASTSSSTRTKPSTA